MKHFNLRHFCFCLCMLLASINVFAIVEIGGIYYNFSGNEAKVTYRDINTADYSGSVVIPESVTYNGKPYSVTSIDNYAFYNCTGLTSITIPNSVTTIGNSAFYGCSGLTSITIPDSVTGIGNTAFYGCSGLTSITIPKNVTTIGGYVFQNCTGLTSVTFEGGSQLTSIGNYAFYGCSGLTSITIPNSVTTIGGYAFYGCSGLTSITIPDSVTGIGNTAFYGCSGLTSITIPKNVTTIGGYVFYGCSSLISIIFEDGSQLTSIGSDAFHGCSGLTSITIPNGVTSIDYSAFYGCKNLTSVIFEEGSHLTSIGGYAFSGCSGLTSITISNSVTSIGGYAFYGCSSLQKVIALDIAAWCGISFGDGYANPLYYAHHLFCDENTEITALIIPEGVTSIGERTFYNCSGLTSITIPNSVTSIGDRAFEYCSGLTSIALGNDSQLTSIGVSAFAGCRSLTSITIPKNVTTIGGFAFDGCSGLTSITFEDGTQLTSIGNSAFTGCSGLTSITIPNSVTSIGNSAFTGCSGFTSVIFGDGSQLTTIGNSAFSGCKSLTSITSKNCSQLTNIGNSAFWQCSGLTSITIPKKVKIIGSSAFRDCYFSKDSLINKSRLTDSSNWGAILCNVETNDGLLIESNHVVKCRYWATFVTIPNNVTRVEELAFSGCSNLRTIIFSDGKKKLSLNTNNKYHYYTPKWFNDCPLDSIYIGRVLNCSFVATDNNQTYTYPPFKNMLTLRSVEYGGNATEIPNDYFSECTNLTSITIGLDIKKIGYNAFNYCNNLKRIVIPNNVEEIGVNAFRGQNLSSLIIEDGEENIMVKNNTTSLSDVFYYNTIDSVYWGRNGALMYCHKIKNLTLGKTKNFEGLGSIYEIGCDTINVLNIKESSDTLCFSVRQQLNYHNYKYYYIMPFNNICIDSIYCNRIIGVYDTYNVSNKHPFDGVESAVNLELGRELTSINDGMFYGCHIPSLFIPNTIKNIASTSFQFCSDLSSVQVEDGSEPLNFSEGDNFYGCPLSSVYLGRNMAYSTNSPFNRNKEAITSLALGNNVTEIPDQAFLGLKNLTDLTLGTGIQRIGKMAFYGCEGLASLSIPGNVTEIGQQAFDLCGNLKAITLEDSSEELTFTADPNNLNNAFTNSPLKDVYIGRNFNYSNVSPFYCINPLQTLTLSNDVTYLKDGAFAGCYGLKEVYSYAENTPNITSNTFGGIEVSKVLLVVPDDAVEKYKSHPIWKLFWIETPTDINSSFAKEEKLTNVYSIGGQRLSVPQKGLNIINGKKVLIK